jgi:WhiB family transcriptional regulator, redox-sensing transcriptional regulator
MKKLRGLPPPVVEAYQWQDQAQCRHLSVALFFEPDTSRGGHREEHERQAKQVCLGCPVIRECLEHALAAEEHGVWGGLTARERAELRVARQAGVTQLAS